MILDTENIIEEIENEETENEEIITTEEKKLEEQNTVEQDEQKETVETNCLALTVRKDYSLSIFKNGFFTTLRVSWKIAVSTFMLNLLKFLF